MNDDTQAYIKLVRSAQIPPGQKALTIFGRLVADEKLFDKAFFGHKTTKKERKRIDHLWRLSMKLGGMDATSIEEPKAGQPEAEQPRGVHGAGSHQRPPLDGDQRSQDAEPTA